MDREAFKKRMQSLKSYRENNPGKGYWEWKVEQFQTGGEKTGYTTYNAYGDITHRLPVSLEEDTLNIGLPDVVVTPRNNLNLASAIAQGRNEVARGVADAATYVTPLGDAEEVYQIYQDTKAGNYGSATAGLALMALPGSIGRLFRKGKNASKKVSRLNITDIENNAKVLTINPTLQKVQTGDNTFFNDYAKKLYQKEQSDIVKHNREFLKTFNKWNRHYGYAPIDLDLDKQPDLAEEVIRNRLNEHNTMVRGVRDVYGKERANIDQILLSRGIEPTTENRLKFFATTYAPSTGAGRSGFTPKYQNEGALYTSNSYNTAAGYAYNRSGDELRGGVAKVRRPVQHYDNLSDQILASDFEFDPTRTSKTQTYVKYELPYLLQTGRSLKQDILKNRRVQFDKELYDKLLGESTFGSQKFKEYSTMGIEPFNAAVKQQLDELKDFGVDSKYFRAFYLTGKDLIKDGAKAIIARELSGIALGIRYAQRKGSLPENSLEESKKILDNAIQHANRRIGQLTSLYNRNRVEKEIKKKVKAKYHLIQKQITEGEMLEVLQRNRIPVNAQQYNLFTTERLRRTTRNSGNPYQHFIFTGPVGQKALDFVEFVDPSQYENLAKSRMHRGNAVESLSRKSYQLGGEVTNTRPVVNKDYDIPMAQNGGEIQGQYALQPIQPSRMQTIGRRILDTATGFLPIAGDLQSIGDAYTAARNRDWLGLGLAGLGIVPFIPTVNKGAITNAIDKVLHRQAKANKVLEEFNRQRDDVYESLIENEEAFRRAANADRTSGSNYLGTYQQLIREYGSDNLRDKVRMEFDPNLYSTSTKAQVNPDDPTYITINTRYKDPDELDNAFKQINPGLIRHEMGHITDVRAGLDYTDKLADPAKFVSDEKLKEMFPSNYKNFRTRILNRGSEIKSYMNEFRQFLYDHGDRDTKETVKSFRRKLDAYGKDFKNLRMIFDSYKNPKQFIKDYNSVPLTSTDRNENLV